jgi:hypothetical protein
MKVEVYSGQRNPERPVAFEWDGQRLEVKQIIADSRQPDGWRFTVLTHDGRIFELFFKDADDEWIISPQSQST